MSKLTGFLIFATGFLGGSVSAYFALKKRFDILMDEEIQSVKEAYEKFNKTENEDSGDESKNLRQVHEEENQKYEQNLPKEQKFEEPYLIPPNEFNEIYGYETASLTLYSDGTIATDDLEVVDDPDELLGEENLQQLRDGEADCIYIRNDSKYCDYEVLRDLSTFEDVVISQSIEEEYE